MAVFNKGINGAFSGKIGNTVGASWRHINYMRSLPKPSKKPASPEQLAQRAKFALAVSFLQALKWIVNIGFNDKAKTRSTGFNHALQVLITQAITGQYPDYAIDFPEVTLSRGNMDKLMGLKVQTSGAAAIHVGWTDLSTPPSDPGEVLGSYPDDQVFVVMYNQTENLVSTNRTTLREEEGIHIEMPSEFIGHQIHVWAFVRHRDGKRVSSSQYAGMVTLS